MATHQTPSKIVLDKAAIIRYQNGANYCGMVYEQHKIGLGFLRFAEEAFYVGEFLRDCYDGLGYI